MTSLSLSQFLCKCTTPYRCYYTWNGREACEETGTNWSRGEETKSRNTSLLAYAHIHIRMCRRALECWAHTRRWCCSFIDVTRQSEPLSTQTYPDVSGWRLWLPEAPVRLWYCPTWLKHLFNCLISWIRSRVCALEGNLSWFFQYYVNLQTHQNVLLICC